MPQGSILGPPLFVIYINNLPNVLNSCYASLYSDDAVIYCYGTSSKELSDKLNNDLLGVAIWLHDRKLTLNLDKTKCMLLGSNRKRESKVDLTVSILDHSICNVRSFKYLSLRNMAVLSSRTQERRSREKNKNRLPGFVAFSTAAPLNSF